MEKRPFITKEKLEKITETYPTPFHIYDEKGKRIERSIYSRPWIDNDSGEIPVTITLRGRWAIRETPACQVVSSDKKYTVLRFICKDGKSQDVEIFPY